ncbi:MAG TPA: PKD domain-containing protein [Terriglobales bacterium]|nr:PKD domain-containing protein [Terriglobales bacterium]
MKTSGRRWWPILTLLLSCLLLGQTTLTHNAALETAQEKTIGVSLYPADGSYTIFDPVSKKPILHSGVAVEIDHHWVRSSEYPQHSSSRDDVADGLGPGTRLTISSTGLRGQPDLIYSLQTHGNPDFLTMAVTVRNGGENAITVQAIRSVEAVGSGIVDLGGPALSDRVLSDSFSEDRPSMVIRDLADTDRGMHRGVGSQLIYNTQTKRSLFVGALASDRFLTILRLHVEKDHMTSYEVDATGTTELEKENSLETSPPEDQIELGLPVAAGASLSSERLLISTGTEYHQQLETYGDLIRELHHARQSPPPIAGWWSWTAYYFGLNQGAALTNARWLAENLKDVGYSFFHIDEGYQYARGEYTTPDAALFPDGMRALVSKTRALGLVPGIWTAPFEVSERAWVYENHKDWLVHNAAGQPIHAGWVIDSDPRRDPLYVLDCTHPGAQEYLHKTYTTLTKVWGIRYIKLDFMDDSAIEGFYYKPNTTALEAQRMGLEIIREAVGDDVLLDKDGSPMLNPVGIVDMGRISTDTGHTFEASKEAAPGIAARYYMNHNFYVADPDAFTVSQQTVNEQAWHGGKHPLTLDEAKVSIALAGIAGGMYEIGDDLPTLGTDPERVALVKNEDLLNVARLGRASVPLDLMSYAPEDGMPSLFLLRESKRQTILTVFNWTEKPTEHRFDLVRDIGLQQGHNQIFDVFNPTTPLESDMGSLSLELPPHSAKVLKIIDPSIPPAAPGVQVHIPDTAGAGNAISFSAEADPTGVPVLAYRWNFGDGTSADGATVTHTYTWAGDFTVQLHADGLDHVPLQKSSSIRVTGKIDTRFDPSRKQRLLQTQ